MIFFICTCLLSLGILFYLITKWKDIEEKGLTIFGFCFFVFISFLIPNSISKGTIRETTVKEDGSFRLFTDKDDTIFMWDGEEVEIFHDEEMCRIYQSGEYQIIKESKVNWYGGNFDSEIKFIGL